MFFCFSILTFFMHVTRLTVHYPISVRMGRARLGKPIVSFVFFHMKRNDFPRNYIWRKTLISMEEHTLHIKERTFSPGYRMTSLTGPLCILLKGTHTERERIWLTFKIVLLPL